MSLTNFISLLAASNRGVQGDAYYSRQDNTATAGYVRNYYDVGTAISSDGHTARCYAGKNSSNTKYYVVVQSFDPQGNLKFWKYDGFDSGYDATQPYDVCVDDDNVYLVYGYYQAPITSTSDRIYMTAFNRDTGAVQWNRMYDNLRINSNNAVGHRLDNGATGELVMSGKYQQNASEGGFIARISKTDGSIVASKRTSDQYTTPTECVGIRYVNGTIFYKTGYGAWSVSNDLTTVNNSAYNAGSSLGFDAGPTLTAALSTGHLIVMNHSFVQQWGVSMTGISNPEDVFIDDDDNVYLSYGQATKVTKFDSTGSIVWQRSLGAEVAGPNPYPVGSRIRGNMFTLHRPNSTSTKQGIFKLNRDGTGAGTYGDITYSSTTQSFSTSTDTFTSTSATLSSDIGSSSSQSVTWYDQGGTNTETVYKIT